MVLNPFPSLSSSLLPLSIFFHVPFFASAVFYACICLLNALFSSFPTLLFSSFSIILSLSLPLPPFILFLCIRVSSLLYVSSSSPSLLSFFFLFFLTVFLAYFSHFFSSSYPVEWSCISSLPLFLLLFPFFTSRFLHSPFSFYSSSSLPLFISLSLIPASGLVSLFSLPFPSPSFHFLLSSSLFIYLASCTCTPPLRCSLW